MITPMEMERNPFARAGLTLFASVLVISAATLPYEARLALLPAAVLFGWTQIGGL